MALLHLVALVPVRAVCAPQEKGAKRAPIALKPPPSWVLQPADRVTYPQLLAWASRGDGGERSVMTLVGKRLGKDLSVQDFAKENAALGERGLGNSRSQPQVVEGVHRVQRDAILEGVPRRVVRQLFYLSGGSGLVLTLVAPQSQALPRQRDLEDTAANLMLALESSVLKTPQPALDGERLR